jgi:serine/threonine protein kinase
MRPDVKKYQPKLGDFGVARQLPRAKLASTVVGTPGTAMAPEVLRVLRARDAAIYAAAERAAGHAGAAGKAPEVLRDVGRLQYNKSVDIYSLGTLWLDMR